jgi:2'-5' RNA ligase
LKPGPERGRARLFFALWPGESARAQLAAWSRELQLVCGGRAPRPEDLHLTLAFLGPVEAARIGDIEGAAGEVASRGVTLVLDRRAYCRHNRIAWAGASATPPELETLARELREALARADIAFDAKPFVVHVTLLRDAREPRAMPVLDPIRWEGRGFVLAGSSPRRGGGRYEILRAW